MRRLLWILPLLLGLALIGCSDDDDNGGGGGLPAVEPVNFSGLTGVPQMIPTQDDDGWSTAGGANRWDLYDDFSIDDGGDDQFDNAFELQVNSTYFPNDQTYDELTFFTPVQGVDQGWRQAVMNDATSGRDDLEGGNTAVLGSASVARLQQTLDLSGAATPLQLQWRDAVRIDDGYFDGEDNFYRVVLRQTDGVLLTTLYSVTGYQNLSNTLHTADVSAHAGTTVVLSFEQRNVGYREGTFIDAVSLTDDNAVEYVTNGDFETGDLSGWTLPALQESANIKSGDRTLEDLVVTRRFYTVPNQMWARYVDSFYNPTDAAIAVDVAYVTNLGSDDYGIIYETEGCSGDALTTWDGDSSDRDIGLHFGNAEMVTYTSDDGLGNGNGSDDINAYYQLNVPPGEVRALVVFCVMDGKDTGMTASSILAKADAVDAVLRQIDAFNPHSGPLAYGIESDLVDKIVNW